MTESPQTPNRVRFQEILSSKIDDFNLAEAALLIAAVATPDLGISDYLRRLDSMADELRLNFPDPDAPHARINRLNAYLFDELGLVGNQIEYYDPRNSFLNDVLDRRMGIPITISLVYMEIGSRLGMNLFGVGMPGHFMVGYPNGPAPIVIDAFNRGRECSMAECAEIMHRIYGDALRFTPDMITPCSRREMVVRMLGNLRAIAGRERDHARALEWSDLAVVASQATARSLRERASVRYQLGDLSGTAADLREAIRCSQSDQERTESQILLRRVEALLHPRE